MCIMSLCQRFVDYLGVHIWRRCPHRNRCGVHLEFLHFKKYFRNTGQNADNNQDTPATNIQSIC